MTMFKTKQIWFLVQWNFQEDNGLSADTPFPYKFAKMCQTFVWGITCISVRHVYLPTVLFILVIVRFVWFLAASLRPLRTVPTLFQRRFTENGRTMEGGSFLVPGRPHCRGAQLSCRRPSAAL